MMSLRATLAAFIRNVRAGAIVHYAVVAAGISFAVIGATNRGGTQARQHLESVSEAFQRYTPLQRLIP